MSFGTNSRHRQRGAALVVGLVLLLVLTLLAVSTLRTAALELLMAGNVQFKENAFQLAETGIDTVVGQAQAGDIPLTAVDGWTLNNGTRAYPALGGEFETRVRYLSTTAAPAGFSSKFRAYHFQIDAAGRTDQRGARSDHSQGVYRVSTGP
jgi:hypothetical protein